MVDLCCVQQQHRGEEKKRTHTHTNVKSKSKSVFTKRVICEVNAFSLLRWRVLTYLCFAFIHIIPFFYIHRVILECILVCFLLKIIIYNIFCHCCVPHRTQSTAIRYRQLFSRSVNAMHTNCGRDREQKRKKNEGKGRNDCMRIYVKKLLCNWKHS